MTLIHIPPELQSLTNGTEQIEVDGHNVRAILQEAERRYPGILQRLCDGAQLRPGIAVIIDGQAASLGLLASVAADSEVHFLPAIAGG